MTYKLIDKLKKKKGRVSRRLDKSKKLDISRKIITVYLANDFYSKNGNNGDKDKKDKKIKFKKKIDKKREKLIEKVNKMRTKNKRLDNLILKLKMRRSKLR